MTTAIKCDGVHADAHKYSDKASLDLRMIIREVRKYFVIPSDCMAGVRFNSDDLVLLSIRSNATEEAALTAPLSWAHAALEDCASRDFHYAIEKQWVDHDEVFGGEG